MPMQPPELDEEEAKWAGIFDALRESVLAQGRPPPRSKKKQRE